MPCPEAIVTCADGCPEEIYLQETAEDQNNESEQDFCSPFCFCHCCQLYKLVVEGSQDTLTLTFSIHENSGHHTLNFFSKEVSSIWHPPKV